MEVAVVDYIRQEREESSDEDSSSSDDYADVPSGPIDPDKCLAAGPGLAGGAAGKFCAPNNTLILDNCLEWFSLAWVERRAVSLHWLERKGDGCWLEKLDGSLS